jgi:Domain of unknown function (DUF6265)
LKLLLAVILAVTATEYAQAASLSDLAFLHGEWVSDRNGFVIEENWTDDKADVVLGMSRGAQGEMVRFLRFAVAEQVGDDVFLRFKRYNADYSSWEKDGPSVMRMVRADYQQVVFEATNAASDVQRITYHLRDNETVNLVANRMDEKGPYLVEFTLRRAR